MSAHELRVVVLPDAHTLKSEFVPTPSSNAREVRLLPVFLAQHKLHIVVQYVPAHMQWRAMLRADTGGAVWLYGTRGAHTTTAEYSISSSGRDLRGAVLNLLTVISGRVLWHSDTVHAPTLTLDNTTITVVETS